MLRPPAEIVGSKRTYYNSFLQDAHGVAAWLNMLLNTERATRGSARSFVRYHDLLGDWEPTITRIGADLALPRLEQLSPAGPRDGQRLRRPRPAPGQPDLGRPRPAGPARDDGARCLGGARRAPGRPARTPGRRPPGSTRSTSSTPRTTSSPRGSPLLGRSPFGRPRSAPGKQEPAPVPAADRDPGPRGQRGPAGAALGAQAGPGSGASPRAGPAEPGWRALRHRPGPASVGPRMANLLRRLTRRAAPEDAASSALLSVVVPAYQVVDYLADCLRACSTSRYRALEVDRRRRRLDRRHRCASPTGSPHADDRVRVVHQANAGLGAARNAGTRLATGDSSRSPTATTWCCPGAYETCSSARSTRTGSDLAIGAVERCDGHRAS